MTPNDSILCQTISNISLIDELSNEDFLNSDYYKKLNWTCGDSNANNIRRILDASGLGNPAMLQMFMYSLLVMPKELLGNDYCKDKFNSVAQKYVSFYQSSYPNESGKANVNYYRHIRNAVAHSKCEYSVENKVCYVTFSDCDKRNNYNCMIRFSTMDVGKLFELLMSELMAVLNRTC